MRNLILIVDDVSLNRMILAEILKDDYDIIEAANGFEALDAINKHMTSLSLVLLDIMMPEMDGFEVLDIIKNSPFTKEISVIFITAADSTGNESRGLRMGAVDYITKPFDPDVVKTRVDTHIELRQHRMQLMDLVNVSIEKYERIRDKTLETLATVIEYRNLESGQHVQRTKQLTGLMMQHMFRTSNLPPSFTYEDISAVVRASALHDIGKISIPDNVLLKPGRLTEEEFEIIKTHTVIGSEIVNNFAHGEDNLFAKHCKDICRHHHERWDGTGYPDRLKGEEIPVSARILALVDVYDALTSPRVYKPPMTHDEAVRIIVEGRGSHFDPKIVDAFLQVQDEFKERLPDEVG